jgi:arylsulfatase A-like enzyme
MTQSKPRFALLRQAVRASIALAAVFILIDLWQVALLHPGYLSATDVTALVGLYLGGAFVAVLCLLGAIAPWRRADQERTVSTVLALLLAGGGFLVAEEVVLRSLSPLSPWRTWAVLGLALLGLLSLVPLTRLLRRLHMPRWGLAVAAVLVVVGALGATRGFGTGSPAGVPEHPSSGASAGARPNVLLITIDTLRADHLSCYGYARPTSPAIDAFAREGILFTRAFAQSSWTKPSTASLLTSHYPTMHQANLDRARVSDAEVLLAEMMRDAGYTTAVLSGNPWVTAEYGFAQGVDHFYSVYDERFVRVTLLMLALRRVNKLFDDDATIYNIIKRQIRGDLSTTARDAILGAEAIRWLGEHRDRPTFLYMHLMSPHHPYDPPPPFDRAFVTNPQTPPMIVYPRKGHFLYEHGDPLSAERLADMIGRYDGDILFGDTVVGKLFAEMRRLELLDRTVVVITADHGEEFYDHQNWGHGHSVYNELLHVPLLVRYPATLPQGARVDVPVMSVDVVPTILELAGVAPVGTLAGRSLVPLMQGKPWERPAEAYAELIYRYGEGRALITADKKLVETTVGQDHRRLLFDLVTDPDENRNLIGDHTDPLPYERRLAELLAWATQHRVDAVEAHVSEDMEKRVRALGYVH